MKSADLVKLAQDLRVETLKMIHRSQTSHVGSCLSMADLLAVLYGKHLKIDPNAPKAPHRDRFILSKGHGAAILYATLAHLGFFPKEWLETYSMPGSKLTGHVHHLIPGIEISTGSLGHGLPIGCGLAYGARLNHEDWRTFVLLSDGELGEGSNWEAALFAAQHRLEKLTAIIDYNKLQSYGAVSEVLELAPLKKKWAAFNWDIREIDGHDLQQIDQTLTKCPFKAGKPSVIIAHTIKGKGVSFMENKLAWHYQSPSDLQLQAALAELGKVK